MPRAHPFRHPAVTETRRAVAAAVVIAAVLLLLPLWVGHYFGLDLTRYELGLLCAIDDARREGHGFSITPLIGNGAALFAEPGAALLYPPRWLSLLFAPDVGAQVFPLFHLVLGAGGVAWLIRSYGARAVTAAAGGVAFVAAGPVFDLMVHANYVVGAAFLPLCWAATRRALVPGGGVLPLIAVAASVASLLLASEPQAFLIAGMCAAMECARVTRRGGVRARPRLVALLVAGSAGALIGAAQMLPTVAESVITRRAAGFPVEEALSASFDASQWLGLITPMDVRSPLGQGMNLVQIWLHPARAPTQWNEHAYVSPLAMAGALAAVFHLRARPAACVALVALFFSLGSANPVVATLYRLVTPLTVFRYPAKFLVIATLGLVVSAALALEKAGRGDATQRRMSMALGLIVCGLVCLWGVVQGAFGHALDVRAGAGPHPLPSEALSHAVVLAALPPCVAIVVLWGVGTPRLRQALMVLVAVDVVAATLATLNVGPSISSLPGSPIAQLPNVEDMVLCVDNRVSGPRPLAGQTPAVQGLAGLRAFATPNVHACDGLRVVNSYMALHSAMGAELDAGVATDIPGAAFAYGCTHVLGPRPENDPRYRRVDVPELDELVARFPAPVALWEITEALPPAFVVRHPVLHRDEESLLRSIVVGDGREGLRAVDDPLHALSAQDHALPSGTTAQATARWLAPDHIVLHLDGSGAAVVGVRTLFLVGWHAAQAGRPLAVVRATGNHLAVLIDDVTAGPVELTYRIPLRVPGLICAALGATVLALELALISRRRRGRQRHPADSQQR